MKSSKLYAIANMFSILAGCTLGLLMAIALVSLAQAQVDTTPVSPMNGLTASLSEDVFKDMLSMEIPALANDGERSTFSGENLFYFLFQFVTGVHPQDPKTMLAQEVSGLEQEHVVLFRGGQAGVGGKPVYPMDMTPPEQMLRPQQPDASMQPEDDDPIAPEDDGATEGARDEDPSTPDMEQPATPLSKSVFIYHSHNRESWVPELEGVEQFSEAFDPEVNVTLLGARLAQNLEEAGIGAFSSNVDYPSSIPEYNWNYSYKYSLDTVMEATAVHADLEYYFDIHRDSQARDLTTVTIEGTDYAQLFFIIGHRNPEWEKNEAFASELHARLEEKYPGISRGVWGKSASTGHAEYNQSISPNSILVEVGGPENTLDESYRTIDALAEVFAEYYYEQGGAEAS